VPEEADDAQAILDAAATGLREGQARAEELADVLDERARILNDTLAGLRMREAATRVDVNDLATFFERPYSILPRDAESVWIIAPRFVRRYFGHLDHSEGPYNWFIANRATLLFGDVPSDVERYLRHKPPVRALIRDGVLIAASERDADECWSRYGKLLSSRDGPLKATIRPSKTFELTDALIRDGTLPFVPRPVSTAYLRPGQWLYQSAIKLRDYQERGYKRFLETGAIGVYWPTGAGKTACALYAMAHLVGPKVVFVPTTTLREQWDERVRKHLSWDAQKEVRIATYQSFDKIVEEKVHWSLAVFDECHTLPALTFAQCATLDMEYRMGLSATPWREDGQESLIFSLTGFPLPTEWDRLQAEGVVTLPDVHVLVCATMEGKLKEVEKLLRPDGGERPRAVVFSDSLALGDEVAKRLTIPFVHGNTKRKLDVIRAARQVVVSRVGDEGLSLDDLDLVVEVDFHGSSRRQEMQRMGRLMHANAKGNHWLLMTEQELLTNDKRLFAYREKGIRVLVTRAE
jgi:DNA excision repair protein ERCC-3